MAKCRVILELEEGNGKGGTMRWERAGPCEGAGTFVLLGRAFEVAQREAGGEFHESILAFFHGAMVQREDLAEVLRRMQDHPPPSCH